jgi:hypothetical protein
MSEWQPIDTAPRNWNPVLVWAISEDEKEDAEDEEREPQRQLLIARHSTVQPGTWWLYGSSMTLVYGPTHWQPLPPAPKDDL